MSKTKSLKWGSDPEFGAGYVRRGHQYVLPPVVFRTDLDVETDTSNPDHPVFMKVGDTVIHEDGCAFEMSTPPSNSWKTIWDNIDHAKSVFESTFLSKYPDVCDMKLHSLPTMLYEVQRWLGRGDEFHLSTRFGCDPDIDVFNTVPRYGKEIDATRHKYRYFGGHIHVSGMPEFSDIPLIAIKCMVVTAGVASTAFSTVPALEKKRLYLYGKPGKMRPQNYPNGETGIEYRTPSTTWTGDFKLAEKIFGWAEIGLLNILGSGLYKTLLPKVVNDAVKSIRNVDQPLAMEVLKYLETQV